TGFATSGECQKRLARHQNRKKRANAARKNLDFLQRGRGGLRLGRRTIERLAKHALRSLQVTVSSHFSRLFSCCSRASVLSAPDKWPARLPAVSSNRGSSLRSASWLPIRCSRP